MILILPVLCSFSRDAALVLVDVLLLLLGCLGGPRGRCSQASFIVGLTDCVLDNRILLPVSLKVAGKLGRDCAVVFLGVPGFLGFLGVGGVGSNLSTGVLTRSYLRLVKSVVPVSFCSVIVKVFFSGSASILSSASLEAPEASEAAELNPCISLVSSSVVPGSSKLCSMLLD